MKYMMLMALATFMMLSVSAKDKMKVSSTTEKMSQGSNPGLSIFIPEADDKDVEKLWKKYMKDFGGKTGTAKGEVFTDDANLPQISANTVDVYAISQKAEGGTNLVVFFDLGGAYVNNSHAGYSAAEKMVYKFALDAAKDAVQQQIDEQEKELKKLESDKKRLEKDKETLQKNIEKWKESIKQAEDDVKKNDKDQQDMAAKIANQTTVVDQVKQKLKDIK